MASVIFSKSSDVNDSIFGKSQEPVRAVITQGVEAFEAHSLLSTVFSMDTSSSFAEKYTSETSLGDFEDVGENGAYPKAGMVEGFSKVIEPTTWKSSFEVTQELVEDAKFGKVKSRASIFTTSYNRTREKFGAALLAGGLGKSVTIGGKVYSTTSADGVPLFSCRITLTYSEGYLTALSGNLMAVGEVSGENSEILSLPTVLMHFLHDVLDSGDVCSAIQTVESGYLQSQSFTGTISLQPVWFISTNTTDYYVNGVTGDVSRVIN